jgi:fido (protein-threonine AMPylation protein)
MGFFMGVSIFHRFFCNILLVGIICFNSINAQINFPKGSTLLRSSKGLKLSKLKYRFQLNEVEYQNIQKIYLEYFQDRHNPLEWFNEKTLKKIHKKMFGNVWSWAGVYYNGKLRNIGIESSEIPNAMLELCREVEGYQRTSSQLTILEQSALILQKLLRIHPFINGNGRFARFVSDLYLHSMHGSAPQWPYMALIYDGEERANYIEALERADFGNFIFLENLILKYGGHNPSIFAIVENSFFKQNYSKSKRKEFLWNQLYFNWRLNTSYIPIEWSPQKSLVEISIYLVDLQASF